MTNKEIAAETIRKILNTCDPGRPVIHWQDRAERIVSDSFNTARANRCNVLTYSRTLHEAAADMGRTFSAGVDAATAGALCDWAAYGWLKPAESAKYDAWCLAQYMAQ